MFDIGFPELLIVALVLLLVVGPERLPEVLRTVGRVVGSARRSFDTLKAELEREVGADDLRRELHNARIMEDAKRLEEDLKGAEQSFKALGQTTKAELTAAEDALRAPPAVEASPAVEAPSTEGEADTTPEAPKPEALKPAPAPQGELAFPSEGQDTGGKARKKTITPWTKKPSPCWLTWRSFAAACYAPYSRCS